LNSVDLIKIINERAFLNIIDKVKVKLVKPFRVDKEIRRQPAELRGKNSKSEGTGRAEERKKERKTLVCCVVADFGFQGRASERN